MKQLALALLLATPLLAAPRTFTVAADGKNSVSFESEATLENIHGTSTKVTGTIVADPIKPAASSVDISVALDALSTGIDMRDEHMKGDKFLDVEKFPNATFRSVSVSGPKSIALNQPADVNVTGDFALHGVTHRITVPVRVVLIRNGAGVHATSAFTIKLTDYGIEVPQRLVLKVANEVKVKLDVFAGAK